MRFKVVYWGLAQMLSIALFGVSMYRFFVIGEQIPSLMLLGMGIIIKLEAEAVQNELFGMGILYFEDEKLKVKGKY